MGGDMGGDMATTALPPCIKRLRQQCRTWCKQLRSELEPCENSKHSKDRNQICHEELERMHLAMANEAACWRNARQASRKATAASVTATKRQPTNHHRRRPIVKRPPSPTPPPPPPQSLIKHHQAALAHLQKELARSKARLGIHDTNYAISQFLPLSCTLPTYVISQQ